ncbi:MAG: hypothetical protein ACE1YV_02665 [Nitrosopumilaceae archaeon]
MLDDEMKELMGRVHESITEFNYKDEKIPCIVLSEKRFSEILQKTAGKAISINTDLNILDNKKGNIFVEISLEFSEGDIHEKILLYANKSLEFFESLAKTSMLAISSPHSQVGQENVFMIQLPKPEKAINALDLIKRGIKKDS